LYRSRLILLFKRLDYVFFLSLYNEMFVPVCSLTVLVFAVYIYQLQWNKVNGTQYTKFDCWRSPAVIWCPCSSTCIMDLPVQRTIPCWHKNRLSRTDSALAYRHRGCTELSIGWVDPWVGLSWIRQKYCIDYPVLSEVARHMYCIAASSIWAWFLVSWTHYNQCQVLAVCG